MMDLDDMDPRRPIDIFGIDSLAAVDIRIRATKGVRIVVHASNIPKDMPMAYLTGMIMETPSLMVFIILKHWLDFMPIVKL